MISVPWAYVFLIILGTMDNARALTCSQDYLDKAEKCLVPFSDAVITISSTTGYSTSVTSMFLFMKVFCARPEFMQALICVTSGIKVCGSAFKVDPWIYTMLKDYDDALVGQMCGYLPALEENLNCLNSLENSTTMSRCIDPTEFDLQVYTEVSCRSTYASAVCALVEVEYSCPSVFNTYQSSLQLAPNRQCRIDSCTLQYGDCGGKFQRNMPQNAIPVRPGDLIAYTYGIEYICGPGKSNLECLLNGDRCEGFRYMMTIPQMFGIELDPVRYLVKYGCRNIDKLSSNMSCLIQQFRTIAFKTCYFQMLSKAGSVPEKPYELVSCKIFEGTAFCINSIVATQCGQEVADYFIKWSPAVFRLADGCGSWKVSSASSMEKMTSLILIQLSIVFKFFHKN